MKTWLSCSVACAALMLSACGAEDYFNTENGAAYREQYTQDVKNAFRATFEEHFGSISPTQTWDFAGVNAQYGPSTRAFTVTEGKSETFDSKFRGALASVLKEGVDNHTIGSAYTLISQGPFDIYPLYHGKCMQWDLYVNDTKIANYSGIMSKMGSTTSYGEASTKELTTTGWHIDLPVGTPIFIKLVVTKNDTGWFTGNGDYAYNGDVITSVYTTPVPYNKGTLSNGSLLLPWEKLNVSKPSNLDQIIMFEDAKTKKGDADFNDFVLGIKGREITPSPIDVITDASSTTYTVEEKYEKRYMIEDLGATDDVDYNDVVVDVTKKRNHIHTVTTTVTEKYQNGKVVSKEETMNDEETSVTPWETSAIIRALGGTLDFNLTIGNTIWNKKSVTGNPYMIWNTGKLISGKNDKVNKYSDEGIDYNAKQYVITGIEGWTPEGNEISIAVFQNRTNNNTVSGEGTWSIDTKFPAAGETPFIIAVPVTQKWAVEREAFNDLQNYLK